MRVTKQFEVSRKLAKTHQNVLVFCKGDPRKATENCNAKVGSGETAVQGDMLLPANAKVTDLAQGKEEK